MSSPAAVLSRAAPFAGRDAAWPTPVLGRVVTLPVGQPRPRLGVLPSRPPAARLPAAVSVALHLLLAAALLVGVPARVPEVPGALVVELVLAEAPTTPEPEATPAEPTEARAETAAPELPVAVAEAAPPAEAPAVAAEPPPPPAAPPVAEVPPPPEPPTATAEAPTPPEPPVAVAEAPPEPPVEAAELPLPPPEPPVAVAEAPRPAAAKSRPPRPPAPRPTTAAAQAAPEPAAATPAASPAAASPATAQAAPSGPPPTYVAQLLAALERHKVYPEEARWRRAQGVAFLRFRMRRDGVVVAHRVERSSGDGALDGAVTAMIQHASPLPAPPPELRGELIELTVPVRFTLR